MKKKFFIILTLVLSMDLSHKLKVCAMHKDNRITIEPDGTKVLNIKSSDIESIVLDCGDENKKIIIKQNNSENKNVKKTGVEVSDKKSSRNSSNSNNVCNKNSKDSSNNEDLLQGLTPEEVEYNMRAFSNNNSKGMAKTGKVESNKNEGKEDITLYELVYNYLEFECKNSIKNSKTNSKEAKEIFLKMLNSLILDFKRTQILVSDTLNNVIKIKNKYSPKKESTLEFDYFSKKKMEDVFKSLVKTIVKNANILNIYETINQEEKMEIPKYIELKQKSMLEKYKDNIFFNIEKLHLPIEEQLNFLFEADDIFNLLIQYYKDFFHYKRTLKSYEEEGYKIKDIVKKIRNDFVIYEDEETKINVIYAKKGKKLKHFIYFKNPTESVIKEVEKVKGNINNNSVEIYMDKYGGIRIVYDDLNEDFLRKIYPCVRQQYDENSKNILFFIKDVTINSIPKPDDIFFEDLKRYSMLKILKENMFNKLYNDVYELRFAEDEEKKNLELKETKKEVSFNLKEIKDKNLFYNKEENFKYVAKVKYYLDCLARFRDIFNMSGDFVKEKFKDLLRSYGFYDFSIKPQNEEDYFEIKICGYESFFENKQDFINKVNKFMDDFSKKLMEETDDSYCYNKLYDSNNTIRLYKSYLNDEEKLEKYLRERDNRGKFIDNEFDAVKNNVRRFAKINNGINGEKTIISAAVVPIDWSEKYRGDISFTDLIIKSFSKYGEPFSNKVIDVDSPFIKDYLLRVFENLVDGVDVFKKTIKENMEDVEVLKNLDY